MKGCPVKNAKARFSELLVACEREGPQLVTKRGVEAAVWAREARGLLALSLAISASLIPVNTPTRGGH